jgi:cobalt-zinc-cadmium resistance protein CzcA
MKHKKSIISIKILILLLIKISGFSQKITLNQAIERAFLSHPSLKIIGLEAESQKKLVLTAKELPKTSFELQVGRIQIPTAMDYAWNVSQTFSHPKYYKTLADLLNKQVSIIEQNQAIRKNELAFQIKQIYTQMYYLKTQQLIVNQQDSVYQVAKNIAKLRKETGEGTPLELMAAESEMDANTMRWQMILQEEKQWMQQLKFLLNVPFNEKIEPILEENLEQKTLAINGFSLENNPLLLLQNQFKEVINSQIIHEKTKFLPEYKAGFINQSMEKRYTPVILLGGINIPLFKKPQKAKIEALKIDEKIINEKQDFLRKNLEQQLQIQLLNYEKYQLMDKYFREIALPRDEKLLDLTAKRYKNSEAIYYEYLQMIQKVFQAKEKHLQNSFYLKQAINEIEFLIGKDI